MQRLSIRCLHTGRVLRHSSPSMSAANTVNNVSWEAAKWTATLGCSAALLWSTFSIERRMDALEARVRADDSKSASSAQ